MPTTRVCPTPATQSHPPHPAHCSDTRTCWLSWVRGAVGLGEGGGAGGVVLVGAPTAAPGASLVGAEVVGAEVVGAEVVGAAVAGSSAEAGRVGASGRELPAGRLLGAGAGVLPASAQADGATPSAPAAGTSTAAMASAVERRIIGPPT